MKFVKKFSIDVTMYDFDGVKRDNERVYEVALPESNKIVYISLSDGEINIIRTTEEPIKTIDDETKTVYEQWEKNKQNK